jgi:hypothetical protein
MLHCSGSEIDILPLDPLANIAKSIIPFAVKTPTEWHCEVDRTKIGRPQFGITGVRTLLEAQHNFQKRSIVHVNPEHFTQ